MGHGIFLHVDDKWIIFDHIKIDKNDLCADQLSADRV